MVRVEHDPEKWVPVFGKRSCFSKSLCAAAAVMLLAACSAASAESGIASIYPQSYKGRRTASGAPLNPAAMTCAHKRHPFGTTLRVSAGAKSITCRVTDRGPFTRGRIIDLTPVAAHALGFSGLAKVSVERM
jgi:peptidoglycan lytic transglycosylase